MNREVGVAARALAIAAIASALLLSAGMASPAQAAGLRTGCQPNRRAVAYQIGRPALRRAPAGAPIPCLEVVSGRAGESADVAVLRSGQILYAPLVENTDPAPLDDRGPAVVARSDNSGRTWETLESGGSNHILDVPPWMSVDPHTQRIWFATVLPDLCGAEISWSDDGGSSWTTNPLVGCPAMGSERVLEGPAPIGGAPLTSAYPHVVYYCANLSDLSQSNLWCYRSLDGGHTFTFTGGFPDPPPKPGCATEHPARPGAVGTDGDLYFPVFQCGALSVAISRDEGASWQWMPVASSAVEDLYTTSMAVDPAGNLYLAWIQAVPGAQPPPSNGGPNPSTEAIDGAGIPVLSISRDHGASWSRPVAVGPPHVSDAQLIAITARSVGQIAISYLANTNGGPLLDGWLSETDDALAPHALWWAAPLNDPATPLIDARDSTTFGDRLFFTTDTFAPGGEPYAAFHCAKTAPCPNQRIGVIGWLATPRAPAGSHPGRKRRAKPRRPPSPRKPQFTG